MRAVSDATASILSYERLQRALIMAREERACVRTIVKLSFSN